jgi:hypothetical protein
VIVGPLAPCRLAVVTVRAAAQLDSLGRVAGRVRRDPARDAPRGGAPHEASALCAGSTRRRIRGQASDAVELGEEPVRDDDPVRAGKEAAARASSSSPIATRGGAGRTDDSDG